MWRSALLLFHLFVCYALANITITSSREKIGFLPSFAGGEWKKSMRIAVERQFEEPEAPINPLPSDDDILSWLKLESKALPRGENFLKAQRRISDFITTKPFPLSLVNTIQKAFGSPKSTPYTRLLNAFSPSILQSFIERSPCAYEKILSLSNYKKLNMGAISVIVHYLREAPLNAICTTKLKKRFKEFFHTHYKTAFRKRDIPIVQRREIRNLSNKKILEILESPSLFAVYLPEDVQDYAKFIIQGGADDEVFRVMSINLPYHEMTPWLNSFLSRSHFQAVEETYGAYRGRVPPFVNDPAVAEHDSGIRYSPQLIALRNHNWKMTEPDFFYHIRGPHISHLWENNERWKRTFHERKMDRKNGKVTFLTLEDDYNSVSMGTATPEQMEAFCANAQTLPDQTAHFWNLKFNRKVMIKDALLGLCFEKEVNGEFVIQKAINTLRLAAHYNKSLECATVELVKTLPEFSWFITLRHLKPYVFHDFFECDSPLKTLIEVDKYTFIFGELHKSLAIALKEHLFKTGLLNSRRFSNPSISHFLEQNQV